MKIEREVRPIEKEFLIDLDFQNTLISKNIKCEEYYDAMCSVRGNYWSVREVGFESQYQTSRFDFYEKGVGRVSIPIPKCIDMVRRIDTPLNHIIIQIDGENYWLTQSKGKTRTYKSSGMASKPEKTISVDMAIKVNNMPLN